MGNDFFARLPINSDPFEELQKSPSSLKRSLSRDLKKRGQLAGDVLVDSKKAIQDAASIFKERLNDPDESGMTLKGPMSVEQIRATVRQERDRLLAKKRG